MEAAIWASLMALAAVNDGGRDGVFATMVNNDDNAMAMAMAVMAFTSVVVAVIGCGYGYSLVTTRADMGESKRGCNGETVMGEGGRGKRGCGARVKAYWWHNIVPRRQ